MVTEITSSKSISDRIGATEKLYNESELGASSEVVLKALDPLIDRRLSLLLDKFEQCPPELGPLLDLRAKISEVWRIRRELKITSSMGRKSWESLQAILEETKSQKGG